MKIYELAPSPSARRVSIFLAEIGVEIERVSLDIRGGANLTGDFLEKSANGLIPLLELEDGTHICESVAICRYLEGLNPREQSLFGNNLKQQASVEMWQRIVELKGLIPAMQAFRNISGVYADRETIVESWGVVSKERLIQFLPTLETQLSKNTYIAGDHFSIADITAFVLFNFAKNLDVQIPESMPNLSAWFNRVASRPSVQ